MKENYQWEVECIDHSVVRQFNEDGSENPSSMINADRVVRASAIPRVIGLPRHDLLVDRDRGEKFVRRFGRGIMTDAGSGIRHREYLHVFVTSSYRFWVFSSDGRSLVTNTDLEVYP